MTLDRPPTPLRRSHALAAGQTAANLRSRAWRRTFHGVYVPAAVPADDVETRIRAAACLLPADGAVSGWAAAWWLGAHVLDGRTPWGDPVPVPLAVPPRRRLAQRDGITVSRAPLPDCDVHQVRGLRVTSPLRTAFELARAACPYEQAVAGVDAMLHVHLVTPAALTSYVAAHARWDRVPQARRAVADADAGAENPMETALRRTDPRRPAAPTARARRTSGRHGDID